MSKRTGSMPAAPTGRAVRGVGDLVDADLPADEVEMLALAAAVVDPDRADMQVVV